MQLNQQRAANGLGPLQVSPLLTASAEWKSLHMAYYNYFDHNDPAPPVARTAEDRMADCGYTYQVAIGENIAEGFSTPSSVVAAWMDSAGHRANILGASFTVMGVGVAANASGAYFWTVDFGGYADPGTVPRAPTPTPPPGAGTAPAGHDAPPPATARRRRRARPRHRRPRRRGGPTTSGGIDRRRRRQQREGRLGRRPDASSRAGDAREPSGRRARQGQGAPGQGADPAPPAERPQPGVGPAAHRADPAPAARQPRRVMHGGRTIRLRLPHRAHGTKRLVYLVTTASGMEARGMVTIVTVPS